MELDHERVAMADEAAQPEFIFHSDQALRQPQPFTGPCSTERLRGILDDSDHLFRMVGSN